MNARVLGAESLWTFLGYLLHLIRFKPWVENKLSFLHYSLDARQGLGHTLITMKNTKETNTMTTIYIVRSAINPAMILCTDEQFHPEMFIGPAQRWGAKIYKTRTGAEKVRGGQQIIVEEGKW